MFNRQKTFTLKEESKTLVVAVNAESPLFKTLEQILDSELKNLSEEPVSVLYTLNKLSAKKVIIINPEALQDPKKRSGVYKALVTLKEDALLLLDTFDEAIITELFEGMLTTAYKFNRFKSKDDNDVHLIAYYTDKTIDDKIHEGIVVGEAINHTKELINTPYNYLNAKKLAEYAKALEDIPNIAVKVYDKAACETMNMGAFLGVNKGSKDEPQLIAIEYRGDPTNKAKTALVGKGVMYDTGGYSLKTSQGMPDMKCDMGGAATVLGALEAAARLEYKANISVIIAATDNRIGDDAIVPDDILTAANGTTIEIISTDAEGRLTLADALWFAQKEGATRIIDVATLTGSIVAALGTEFTGAFTNNPAFLSALKATADKNHEKLWEMPISEGYREALKSYSADITNSGGRLAGASIAATFLEKFIENDTPWIHLDIAGTSFDKKTGATGILVKTLARLFS